MNASGAAGSARLPRACRIRRRGEFLELQRGGRRQTTPHFVVLTRNRPAPPPRLGITTSRKVGSAPQRNRVRRLVREFFRRNRSLIGNLDVVVIAKPTAAEVTFANVDHELGSILATPGPRS